jgi:L-ascorbate metabolism protein UlaG (beta-lactamase superfamily)
MNPSPSPWPRRRFLRATTLAAGAALTAGVATTLAADSSLFPISDHCDGRRFFNPRGKFERSFLRLLRWKMAGSATRWPERIELTPQMPPAAPRDGRLAATWINHATFLLQTRHGNVLTDPVWSERAGPGSFGPRRVHPPGVRFDDLPKIDAVLLSHDHYDHCDVTTLKRLAVRDAPLVIAPLGHRALLTSAGVARDKIVELDWWQSHPFGRASGNGAATITLTPARHWSNRATGSVNGRLWGGFFLRTNETTAWFAGDTAYDDRVFREIGAKLGAPHLALIPIGAYAPRWFMAQVHCDPAEAVQIHRDVGARRSIGMHWGTFQLTDEGRDAPPAALAEARRAAGIAADAFHVLAPGESVFV